MSQKPVTKLSVASCPDCGERITLKGRIYLGRSAICPNCDAELQVTSTSPLELDWRDEDDDEYEDKDD